MDRKFAAIEDYARNYDTLTDEQAADAYIRTSRGSGGRNYFNFASATFRSSAKSSPASPLRCFTPARLARRPHRRSARSHSKCPSSNLKLGYNLK